MADISAGIAGVGVIFKRSDMTSNPTFTAIAEINSIQGPDMSRTTNDFTSLDTTGGYRIFRAGFRDGGQCVLEMNFTRDGWLALKSDFDDAGDGVVDYQIVLPDTGATTLSFSGIVVNLGMGVGEAKITAPCTIKLTGTIDVES